MIDLHIHTTASADGQYPPEIIVEMAVELGLSAIAIADHNVVGSVLPGRRLCAEAGIDFIEAIELNSDYQGKDLHILGYGFDPENSEFIKWLNRIEEMNLARTIAWAQNLNRLGVKLDFDKVAALTPGRLPTGSSFLRAAQQHSENHNHPLIHPYLPGGEKSENPYVLFYFEVLAEGPAKADCPVLTTYQAIEGLKKYGALPVLAHPAKLDGAIVVDLVDHGIAGIEAVSSYHDEAMNCHYLALAKTFGILATAGSDFHGPKFKKQVKLGGITPNDRSFFESLKKALHR